MQASSAEIDENSKNPFEFSSSESDTSEDKIFTLSV